MDNGIGICTGSVKSRKKTYRQQQTAAAVQVSNIYEGHKPIDYNKQHHPITLCILLPVIAGMQQQAAAAAAAEAWIAEQNSHRPTWTVKVGQRCASVNDCQYNADSVEQMCGQRGLLGTPRAPMGTTLPSPGSART